MVSYSHKIDKEVQAPFLSRLRLKKLLAKAKEVDDNDDDIEL